MAVQNVDNLRVLIVAEHASARWGGEAILPLHYFRILRQRGIQAWLVVHERTQPELAELLPEERDRIHYIPDTRAHVILHHIGQLLPHTINYFSFQLLVRSITQFMARRIARQLVVRHGINVVHQPIPVSPRETSLMYSIGAPVIIGPMNGGMSYPPAFSKLQTRGVGYFVRAGRMLANIMNRMVPGKLRAETLLVANQRTREALPSGTRGKIVTLVENGVDLNLWSAPRARADDPSQPVRFVFAGRLIEWKGVDLLLEAFAATARNARVTLDIIGDGNIRGALEQRAVELGIRDSVNFVGWLQQEEMAQRFCSSDAFVLPSLYECGGAVVLEAMACGLPAIATRWGGPADYLDDSCGILVEPSGRDSFVDGLANAMLALARDPALRRKLGDAGRAKTVREFDWQRKVDRMLEVYLDVASSTAPAGRGGENSARECECMNPGAMGLASGSGGRCL